MSFRSQVCQRDRRPVLRRAGSGEQGYTLLLVLFFAAVMLIGASVAVPRLILQARRQQEKMMIWRGQQYARAIGLYYRKTGHFPHDLEELEKGVDGVHFLRQAYKDPMNTDDGSWRLIYLGQGGQLLGSLRWHTLAEYQAAQMGITLPTGAAPGTNGSNSGASGGTTGTNGQASGSGTGSSSQNPQQPTPPPQTRIINEGDMVGGNLIGVASKAKGKSVKVFMGADNYREWEFIWNPLEGAGPGTTPGVSPTGGIPPVVGQPPASPPQPKPPQGPNL